MAVKVWGINKNCLATPSISLKSCYYPPPAYFLAGFKEIPSTILAKSGGICPPTSSVATLLGPCDGAFKHCIAKEHIMKRIYWGSPFDGEPLVSELGCPELRYATGLFVNFLCNTPHHSKILQHATVFKTEM